MEISVLIAVKCKRPFPTAHYTLQQYPTAECEVCFRYPPPQSPIIPPILHSFTFIKANLSDKMFISNDIIIQLIVQVFGPSSSEIAVISHW